MTGPEGLNCQNKLECYGWEVQFKCLEDAAKKFVKKDIPCVYGDGEKVSCSSVLRDIQSKEARANVSKQYGCKDAIGRDL